jgi:hypothetical protein
MEDERIYAGRTKIINFYKKFGITEDNKYPNLIVFWNPFNFSEEVELDKEALEMIKKGKRI